MYRLLVFNTREKWLYIKKRRKCPERKSVRFTRGSDSMNTNASMTHYMSSRFDGIFIPSNQIFIDSQGGVKTIIQLSCTILWNLEIAKISNTFFSILGADTLFSFTWYQLTPFPALNSGCLRFPALWRRLTVTGCLFSRHYYQGQCKYLHSKQFCFAP